MAQNNNANPNRPQKPTVKSFLIKFLRILVLCALAYGIVYGVRFLMGAA